MPTHPDHASRAGTFPGAASSHGIDWFTRRSVVLSGGSIAAQAIVVLGSPLLTRLYGPADFGVFAVLTAWISIVGPVACLGLETPLLAERDDRRARALTMVGLISSVGTTLLLTGGLATCALLGWPTGISSSIWASAWVIPLGVLLYSLAHLMASAALRGGAVMVNGVTQVVQALSQLVAQTVLAALAIGGAGLSAGYVVGMMPRALWLAKSSGLSWWVPNHVGTSHDLATAIRREWRYPVISVPSTLLRLGSQFLPVVLVTLLYGPAVGGLFGLGQRVITMPVRMIGLATAQSFTVEAGLLDHTGLHRLFVHTVLRFSLVALAWGVPLAIAAPGLFEIIFGEAWREAGEFVRALMPIHLARFVHTPVSSLLNLLQRHDLDLVLAIALVAALGSSFALAAALDLAPLTAMLVYSGSSGIVFVATIWIAWRTVHAVKSTAH